jgi:hypothetical protein
VLRRQPQSPSVLSLKDASGCYGVLCSAAFGRMHPIFDRSLSQAGQNFETRAKDYFDFFF